jgi:hypothetical protein
MTAPLPHGLAPIIDDGARLLILGNMVRASDSVSTSPTADVPTGGHS